MPDIAISALPAQTPVASSDVLPLVEGGTTKKATVLDVVKGGGALLRDGSVPATADLPMGTHKITGMQPGAASDHGINKGQLDAVEALVLKKDGSVAATGDFNAGGNQLTNVGAAGSASEVPPLSQVQALIAAAVSGAGGGGGDGFAFTFDPATGDADPTAGKLRYNSATLASVTQIFVDLLDVSGNDLTGWLDRLDDSLNAVKGYIRVGSKSDPTKWALFTLTGLTTISGYRKLPVTFVTSGAGGLPTTTAADTFLSFEVWGLPNTITDALIDAAAAIALSKLAQGTACSFVARGANSTGSLALVSVGTNGFVPLRRSNVLTAGLLLNENVDPSAAIACTKTDGNFGSTVVISTGGARFGTSPATTGILNIPNNATLAAHNQAGTADVAIAKLTTADKILLGSAAATGISVGSAGATALDHDGVVTQIGDGTFQGFEHAFLASSRDVIALCRAVPITTAEMGTGSGNGVANIAPATDAPTAKPFDGTTVWGNEGLGAMGFGEGGVESVIAPQGSSTAKLRKFVNVTKQGNLTSSSATADQVIVTLAPTDINGAALPNGGVCWVEARVVARRAYNSAYRYGAQFRALVSFSTSGFSVALVETETPLSGDGGTTPNFNIIDASGSLKLVITPATTDALICFGVLRIDGDSDT